MSALAVKNDEYYGAINMQAAELLPAISKKINDFITVTAQPLIEMAQIAEDVQESLLKLLNVVHPSCHFAFERYADETLNLRVIKQAEPEVVQPEQPELEGVQTNVENMHYVVKKNLLPGLESNFEDPSINNASVDLNQFTYAEQEVISEIFKQLRPKWEIAIKREYGHVYLKAMKPFKVREMEYRLDGVTHKNVLPSLLPIFVRDNVDAILLAGQDRANFEFDDIDDLILTAIVESMIKSRPNWQHKITTKNMGKNKVTYLEITNPVATPSQFVTPQQYIHLTKMVDYIEYQLRGGKYAGASTDTYIDDLTIAQYSLLTDLIQQRMPKAQYKTIQKPSERVFGKGKQDVYLLIEILCG